MTTTSASTDGSGPRSSAQREGERTLALLRRDRTGAVSVAVLRDGGVGSPAQAIYDLQLAGYAIDRVSQLTADGQRTRGYRLHNARSNRSDQAGVPAEDRRGGG